MKILYVNYLYDITQSSVGAAVHVQELAKALRAYNYDVKVCFINRFSIEDAEQRVAREFLKKYLSKYLGSLNALLSNIYYFFREWKLVFKKRPDVLLVRYNFFNFSIAVVCKVLRIPFILEINAPGHYESKVFSKYVIKLSLLGWFFERLMIRFARRIYVVSKQLKQFYVKHNIPGGKIQVIVNGVDEIKINPSVSSKKIKANYNLEGKTILGFVGSFHYWHGIQQLQSLIKDVLAEYTDTVFLLIGDGPLKKDMENFIRKQNITDKVLLPGYIKYDDIPFYLSSMDIVLAPYPKHKLFYYSPIKLFEYMAAGKSVVATSIGQIKEIIEDGVNGLLYEAENYDAMLKKTNLLLQDNALCKRIGKEARKTIEDNYTWKHTAKKLDQIIQLNIVGSQYKVKSRIDNKKKIKVLQLVEGFNLGGAEKKLLELVQRMNPDCFQTVVCSLGLVGPSGTIANEFRQLRQYGVDVIEIPRKHRIDFSLILKLVTLVKNRRIDIIMTNLFYADIMGIIVGRLGKVKAVFTWEATPSSEWLIPRRLLSYRALIPWCDKIIAVSQATAEFLIKKRKINPDKIKVIPYGVDLTKYNNKNGYAVRKELGLSKGDKTIGTIGRLHQLKGHKYLIEASAKIIKQYPQIKFIIIGEGEYRSRLENLVSKHKLDKYYKFLGFRDDIPELLQAIDIFTLPSLTEGLPNVVLEAMASRKPIVATPVGGIKEAVIDGITGILVPPKDYEGLSKALCYFLENPDKAVEFGRKGRERVEELFSLQNQIKSFENIYKNYFNKSLRG
ncbi:MAG: glycosyltransferase [bacterium]